VIVVQVKLTSEQFFSYTIKMRNYIRTVRWWWCPHC